MRQTTFLFIILIFLLSLSLNGYAQLTESNLPKIQHDSYVSKIKKQFLENNLTDTLDIPFWDDFSKSSYTPDTLWSNAENIYISTHTAINPPSINVATFDGADQYGKPYSNGELKSKLADELTSRPIDLSTITENKKNTVYLSFFWQFQGLGDAPEANDSIRLQFKDNNDNWITQWSKSGSEALDNTTFEQVLVPINLDTFFYKGFQFRFQSFNQLSGMYDLWHIDYVYLNQNRSINDTFMPDRAFSSYPTSIFKPYTAIPIDHFFNQPEKFIISSSAVVFNHSDIINPVFTDSSTVIDTINKVVLVNSNNQDEQFIINPFDFANSIATTLDQQVLNPNQKSIILKNTFYAYTEDTLLKDIESDIYFEHIDLRVNDTVSSFNFLDDYYAYDDGTAEKTVGINNNGGKLAYQYIFEFPDTITHFDIYFADPNQINTPIDLFIWKKLNDEEVVISHTPNLLTQHADSLNKFTSYKLAAPAMVQDTIYIGFQQNTDNRLAVGLDKNTNTKEKIFYNINNEWFENTQIEGSLMIRPRMDRTVIANVIDNDKKASHIPTIYPNPSSNFVIIDGIWHNVLVYNIFGNLVKTQIEYTNNQTIIYFINPSPGIFLIKFNNTNQQFIKKLQLK